MASLIKHVQNQRDDDEFAAIRWRDIQIAVIKRRIEREHMSSQLSDVLYRDVLNRYNKEIARIRGSQYYDDYSAIARQAYLGASHDAEDEEDEHTQGEMYMNMLKTKFVAVKFTNGNSEAAGYDKQYTYLTDDLTIKTDDYCIVIGPSGAPAVVRVYDDNALPLKGIPGKMILCKIDMDTYREKQRIIVQRAAALKRLEEIEKEQGAQERFKKLAEHSEEAAELLKVLGLMTPSTAIEGTAVGQAQLADEASKENAAEAGVDE
jgi:hypothetical protein